jgi:hypothetical protein
VPATHQAVALETLNVSEAEFPSLARSAITERAVTACVAPSLDTTTTYAYDIDATSYQQCLLVAKLAMLRVATDYILNVRVRIGRLHGLVSSEDPAQELLQ